MANEVRTKIRIRAYPLLNPKERVAIWEKARGMWRARKPDPLEELKKIRQGWAKERS